jgi:hypothetical protein
VICVADAEPKCSQPFREIEAPSKEGDEITVTVKDESFIFDGKP